MEARIETLAPMRVVAVPHKGAYHLIGATFDELAKWSDRNHVRVSAAVGVWYDDPATVPEDELRSDACFVLMEDFALPTGDVLPGMRLETIPGGEHAVATHLGDYSGLGRAWDEFWSVALPKLGRRLSGAPSFEVYVNDCRLVPIEEVRTDLCVPLAP